jgi:hypothetical protein
LDNSFFNKLSSFTETEKMAFRKKVLIFGFFLTVSVILWLIIELGKRYSDTINFPVSYKNFPESKVLIDDLPDYLTLNVNADGYTLLRFRLSSKYTPISFSVNSFKMNRLPGADSTSFYIETRLARDHILSQLSNDITLNKISPDTLIFRFSEVKSRKIPVIPVFQYTLDKQLILKDQLDMKPDSITVSGPDFIIDTIKAVYTKTSDVGRISRTTERDIDLQGIKFVYFKEKDVNVGFKIEQFTEKTLNIPVEIINLPKRTHMQSFPRFIQLTCQVGLSNYEKLSPDLFRAHIDYNEIAAGQSSKLKVSISRQPGFVQAIRFTPKTVEYIIEK